MFKIDIRTALIAKDLYFIDRYAKTYKNRIKF